DQLDGPNGAIVGKEGRSDHMLVNTRDIGGFDDNDMKLLTLLAAQIAGAVAATLSRERQEKANRLATIGQMLSGVIHDFKTPVTIISGYVQLMARQNDPDIRKEYAESVLKQFDQLNKMTREILAFARGESSILLRKVFIHTFADELRELLSRELADRGITLELETRYRGAVKMDDVKLKRAIFNLARNAAEAMPDGGHFEVTLDREGDDVVFAFTDTGRGIPVEIRASLFESFVTQGKEGGTGLGLAIVKKIVEEHNGTITFTSETDVGTTFTIRIPLEPAQAAA
ncbi:MAG: HAMP domain-containing sensor histidine kinase, partial [Myxococcota bacterium]